MPGTVEGARRARDTNYKRYGRDYYKTVGRIGGLVTREDRMFAKDKDLAKRAGMIGGKNSKRSHNANH